MKLPPLSRFEPNELYERIVQVGETWAEKDASAALLEESRKSVLAELAQQASGGVAERERAALESQIYRDHIRAMVEARKQANIARVHYDAAKAWWEMNRTLESTRRAEMAMR